MKKLWILFLTLPLLAFAQHREHHADSKMTLEQQATLRAKEMKVTMSLTDKQEKQLQDAFLEHSKSRPEKPKNPRELSADERYEMRLSHLEHLESLQESLQDILTEEQYAMFKKHSQERMARGKKRMMMQKKHKKCEQCKKGEKCENCKKHEGDKDGQETVK